jgi:hypothetical protein
MVVHVINRGVGRQAVFHEDEDYAAFERVIAETHQRTPVQNRDVTMPADWPGDWLDFVNEPQTEAELEAIRQSVNRGRPYGGDDWQKEAVERMGLQAILRLGGRPRNTVTQEAI